MMKILIKSTVVIVHKALKPATFQISKHYTFMIQVFKMYCMVNNILFKLHKLFRFTK